MQAPSEHPASGPIDHEDAKAHHCVTVSEPLALQGYAVASLEQLDSEEFHSLLDTTMSKSVTQTIYTAMGAMSDNISHSIANAIRASNANIPRARVAADGPVHREGRKATSKTCNVQTHTSKTELTDRDKVLDTLGPSAKIFELVKVALTEGTPIDLLAIRGWAQRSICLIGNANAALATERSKTILMKIEPKLVNMALTEPGPQAKVLLFGDNFVKELSTYVSTFTALDKAQTNIKRVFGVAGRHRGRLPGRSSRGSYRGYRGPATARFQPPENRAHSPFFPVRGRPWQPRGTRGNSYSRRPYDSFEENQPSHTIRMLLDNADTSGWMDPRVNDLGAIRSQIHEQGAGSNFALGLAE
ncbi:Hypothetical predicted protein [Pelobates cultripes]|uniref:Uncharacterized protein n=1 Tax=Pelobates cultripes TaxID=61616 RepID=A0AAD1SJV5_PELCU|nr:Hypothetical predicted protein [Pelobates cultripes]